MNSNPLELDNAVITKIKEMSASVSPEIGTQMLLVHMLDSPDKTLSDVLLTFYGYGNAIPEILIKSGVGNLLKQVYHNFNIQLDDKVHGIIGVTDDNTYIFDFLISQLPELYAEGKIKSRPIDDMMSPSGVLPLLMTEVHKNKEAVLEKIKNTMFVMGDAQGMTDSLDEIQEKYSAIFGENLKKVSNIFENSDINYFFSVIKQLEKVLEKPGSMLPATMEETSMPERWTEDMSYLMTSIVKHQNNQGKKIEFIYDMIKSGDLLPAAESSDENIIDIQEIPPKMQEEMTQSMKEVLTEFFKQEEDAEEEEDSDVAAKIDDILKKVEAFTDSESLKEKLDNSEGDKDKLLFEILDAVKNSSSKGEGEDNSNLVEVLESLKDKLDNPKVPELSEDFKEKHNEILEKLDKIGDSSDDSVDSDGSKMNEIKELINDSRDSLSSQITELKEMLVEEDENYIEDTNSFPESGFKEEEDADEEDDEILELFENMGRKIDAVSEKVDKSMEKKIDAVSEKVDKSMQIMMDMFEMVRTEISESSKLRAMMEVEAEETPKAKKSVAPKKEKKGWFGGNKKKKDAEVIEENEDGELGFDDVEEI